MGDFSFEIKTSRDFLGKLQKDCEDFSKDKTSSRVAINCAMTAWHLTEWIYNEFKDLLKSDFSNFGTFRNHIRKMCPSLGIMQDISNGSKHYAITLYKPSVKDTKLHNGAFSNDFSRDFDISSLIIKMENGDKLFFEDEIMKCHIFWMKYFTSTISLYERKASELH